VISREFKRLQLELTCHFLKLRVNMHRFIAVETVKEKSVWARNILIEGTAGNYIGPAEERLRISALKSHFNLTREFARARATFAGRSPADRSRVNGPV
jgi:hypothetical protein